MKKERKINKTHLIESNKVKKYNSNYQVEPKNKHHIKQSYANKNTHIYTVN